MRGRIVDIRPRIRDERLKVIARIRTKDWGNLDAYLPDRELAAILPRGVLIGDQRRMPRKYIKTVAPIVKRMASEREVQVWTYQGSYYFRFLSWKGIRFGG